MSSRKQQLNISEIGDTYEFLHYLYKYRVFLYTNMYLCLHCGVVIFMLIVVIAHIIKVIQCSFRRHNAKRAISIKRFEKYTLILAGIIPFLTFKKRMCLYFCFGGTAM